MLMLLPVLAEAKVKTETVEYKQGDTVLEGYWAWDDAAKKPKPAVIVVHEWKGPGEYTRQRAQQLAKLGYVAFAADIYGKDVRPRSHEEAGKAAGMLRENRDLMRARAQAAIDLVAKDKRVDPSKMAAIGYCFGGTTVLELARSGAKVGGVVSFHGGLDSPAPADGKNIKSRVLVLHGASDKGISDADKLAFEKELTDAKVDWQLVEYGGAVHCFTHKDAGNDPSKGCAYDARADTKNRSAFATSSG